MKRRSFLGYLTVTGGLFGWGFSSGQTAIVQKGKAVICETSSTKCPLGHETCREIDAPPVVGSGTYQNPDVAALKDYKLLRCQVCGVLFAEKS